MRYVIQRLASVSLITKAAHKEARSTVDVDHVVIDTQADHPYHRVVCYAGVAAAQLICDDLNGREV